MLGDLNGAQVGCPPVVARHVSIVIQELLEIVVEGVGGSVRVDLHNSNKLILKSPQSQKHFPIEQSGKSKMKPQWFID